MRSSQLNYAPFPKSVRTLPVPPLLFKPHIRHLSSTPLPPQLTRLSITPLHQIFPLTDPSPAPITIAPAIRQVSPYKSPPSRQRGQSRIITQLTSDEHAGTTTHMARRLRVEYTGAIYHVMNPRRRIRAGRGGGIAPTTKKRPRESEDRPEPSNGHPWTCGALPAQRTM